MVKKKGSELSVDADQAANVTNLKKEGSTEWEKRSVTGTLKGLRIAKMKIYIL